MNRIRWGFARLLMKVTGLSFVPQWGRETWTDIAFRSLVGEGYKANAAVWSCVRVYARSFPEPELHVWRSVESGKERIADHPMHQLMARWIPRPCE